ncbi:MAG: hypothetical protein K9L76_00205 [Candidatus Omnitrophica bacterium]|nr:hypothetical protein [Candidatus Omnitrophota bacterium]
MSSNDPKKRDEISQFLKRCREVDFDVTLDEVAAVMGKSKKYLQDIEDSTEHISQKQFHDYHYGAFFTKKLKKIVGAVQRRNNLFYH